MIITDIYGASKRGVAEIENTIVMFVLIVVIKVCPTP